MIEPKQVSARSNDRLSIPATRIDRRAATGGRRTAGERTAVTRSIVTSYVDFLRRAQPWSALALEGFLAARNG